MAFRNIITRGDREEFRDQSKRGREPPVASLEETKVETVAFFGVWFFDSFRERGFHKVKMTGNSIVLGHKNKS
jgi:hypothetical protein